MQSHYILVFVFFFFNDTATTEIYTLSLHDALPIFYHPILRRAANAHRQNDVFQHRVAPVQEKLLKDKAEFLIAQSIFFLLDRKSTRLNSSHANISYAVFCLKKKKNN